MANKIQGGVTSFLNNVYEKDKYSFRTVVIDQSPISGNNGTTELGYNASGQLIRIRKVINSVTYTKNVTGTEITDSVVTVTKTFGTWS